MSNHHEAAPSNIRSRLNAYLLPFVHTSILPTCTCRKFGLRRAFITDRVYVPTRLQLPNQFTFPQNGYRLHHHFWQSIRRTAVHTRPWAGSLERISLATLSTHINSGLRHRLQFPSPFAIIRLASSPAAAPGYKKIKRNPHRQVSRRASTTIEEGPSPQVSEQPPKT